MEALLLFFLKWKVIELVLSSIFVLIVCLAFAVVIILDHVDMRKRIKKTRP